MELVTNGHSHNNIKIKQASIDDLRELLDWRIEVLREVFSLSDTDDIENLRKANEEYYLRSIAEGSHIACFAECVDNNKKIGCGGICFHQEMPSPDNVSGICGYLMNIYVREAFRRQNVGQKIVEWLIERARSKNISKIYLESSEIGVSFYRSIGFSPMKDMMIFGK